MKKKTFYWFKRIILIFVISFMINDLCYAQGEYEDFANMQGEISALQWELKCYGVMSGKTNIYSYEEVMRFKEKMKSTQKKIDILGKEYKIKFGDNSGWTEKMKMFLAYPAFNNKEECNHYKVKLGQERDAKQKKVKELNESFFTDGEDWKSKWNPSKANISRESTKLRLEAGLLNNKYARCDCDKMEYGATSNSGDDGLEKEFLAEISKINSDIAVINRLARQKQIVESFGSAQILCDKLRRYHGNQYFSRTLKKIRKENPGFSFSITPLAEEITREYWIRMRNRANIAYRNAMDAYKGCAYNEKIQSNTKILIPLRFAKTIFDFAMSCSGIFNKKILGTIQDIYSGIKNKVGAMKVVSGVTDDYIDANESAFDWKSYTGVVRGVISAYDNYKKVYGMIVENGIQGDLLVMNRQSAQQLMKSNKNLLQHLSI